MDTKELGGNQEAGPAYTTGPGSGSFQGGFWENRRPQHLRVGPERRDVGLGSWQTALCPCSVQSELSRSSQLLFKVLMLPSNKTACQRGHVSFQ